MSDSTEILSHIDARVMTLSFNRLTRKNSITTAMYNLLADALEQAAQDTAVHVVLIQGDASIFTAGNDIADFISQIETPIEPPQLAPSTMRFLRALAAFPKPLVAAVCGPAVGIGATLLFHCDLVYAGDNATFTMPFVNLGLVPESASSLLVPQILGYHRAAEALMLGESLMAETAREVGLVNRVLPPADVNTFALKQARKLADKPLSALIETKRLMKLTQQSAVQLRLEEESGSFGRMMRGPAAREALTAFTEKRKPDFSGL